jgi:hypothetical protein
MFDGGCMDNIESMTGNVNWKKRRKQLSKIEYAALAQRSGDLGPDFGVSVIFASIVCLSGLGVIYAFDLGGEWGQSNALVVGVVIGTVFSLIRNARDPESRSWIGRIDGLLSSYDPIYKPAYHELQQRTRKVGYLEPDYVLEWVSLEKRAVDDAAGDKEPLTFLSKKL